MSPRHKPLPESLTSTLRPPASSFLHLTSHVAVEWSAPDPATKDVQGCAAALPIASMLHLTPKVLLILRLRLERLHSIETGVARYTRWLASRVS
jgi:hypothetical protein